MNIDAFTNGLKRANAQRKQRQANAVATARVSIPANPATQQQTVKPSLAIKPAFNVEAYRLDIIAKAIAHIFKQKGEVQ